MFTARPASNIANAAGFEMSNMRVASYGLKYNFYQYGAYNLSASLHHYSYFPDFTYLYAGVEMPGGGYGAQVWGAGGSDAATENLVLNLAVERYFPVGSNYFMLGAGPELRYIHTTNSFSNIVFGTMDVEGNFLMHNVIYYAPNKLNLGLRADAGFGLASNIGLFELKLHGHLGFSKFLEGVTTINNMPSVPASNSRFSIKDNYVGFGVSYYPKRRQAKD